MVLSACALILGGVSVFAIRGLKATLDAVTGRDTAKVRLAGSIQYSAADLLRLENGIIFRLMSQDQAGSENYRRLSSEMFQRLSSHFDSLRPLMAEGSANTAVAGMIDTARAWSGFHEQMIQALQKQEYDAAQKTLSDQITPTGERLVSQAGEFSQTVTAALAEAQEAAGTREQAYVWITTMFGLLSLACAVAVHLVVRTASTTLQRVAAEVSGHAEQVANSAQQISAASQSVARAASNQAASLEQTSASSEEINSITHRSTENVGLVANRMGETEQLARKVSQAIDDLMASMQLLNRSSEKISGIIKVIDEIAFQTNVLALNAAVEAARAGKMGMGFAVVADEVRNLAQRSANAARETAALIAESISKSQDGNKKAENVAVAVRSITENSIQVKSLIDDLNRSAQEQATGINEIARAILRMQKVTQETAASAEQGASAGSEMSAQSDAMERTARELVGLVGGH
jgi:methyl-accepting chemotaxis protein/methyl-accepting chemotaxis protein-1 (serine sensor receptor)